MMQKVVLNLELHDDKTRRKAIKTASNVSGVESISIDSKDNKLTVTGDFDPVCLVSKLRKKLSHADIHSVGPAKEEKKKEEPKKEEQKKEGPKEDDIAKLVKAYQAYNPYMTTHYCVYSAEENPNACVIC